MTTTMRAISQDVFGSPEVLKLVELDRPEAGTFPLADEAKAHQAGDPGHVAGKLVLTAQ